MSEWATGLVLVVVVVVLVVQVAVVLVVNVTVVLNGFVAAFLAVLVVFDGVLSELVFGVLFSHRVVLLAHVPMRRRRYAQRGRRRSGTAPSAPDGLAGQRRPLVVHAGAGMRAVGKFHSGQRVH